MAMSDGQADGALWALCAIGVLLAEATGHAQRPLPAKQWTPAVHIELARCVVGESGFRKVADHAAIPWALARRWRTISARRKQWSFAAQIRAYCKGGRPRARARQWVRKLPAPGGTWPKGAGPNRRRWEALLSRLDRWARGLVADPCRGAEHWGSMRIRIDRVRAERAVLAGRWRRLWCGRARNAFFARR